jgi:hypothetical protein
VCNLLRSEEILLRRIYEPAKYYNWEMENITHKYIINSSSDIVRIIKRSIVVLDL